MVHVPMENLLFFFFKTGCGSKNPLRRKIGNYFAWELMEQGLYLNHNSVSKSQ
jgi:hypothetical protein